MIDGSIGEGNHDVAAAVGGCGVLLDDGCVFSAGGCVDVEVGQHRGSVDGYVELAATSGGEVELREVQAHAVAGSCGQAGDAVGHYSLSGRLVDRRWSRGGADTVGDGDGVGHRVSAAAGVVFIGDEGIIAAAGIADCRAARVDRYN